jgi:hypothetical protein
VPLKQQEAIVLKGCNGHKKSKEGGDINSIPNWHLSCFLLIEKHN